VLENRPVGGPAESELEVKAIQALRSAGIPLPKRQHRLRLSDDDLRLDLAYPEFGIAIECDSAKFHATRQGWERDRRKSNLLNLAGWTVVRGTWDEVEDGEFVRSVAQALNLRNGYRSPSTITERSGGYDRVSAEGEDSSATSEEKRWKD
jgi:very-short-patch-repair endonuclease